jgi:hypothetical protein
MVWLAHVTFYLSSMLEIEDVLKLQCCNTELFKEVSEFRIINVIRSIHSPRVLSFVMNSFRRIRSLSFVDCRNHLDERYHINVHLLIRTLVHGQLTELALTRLQLYYLGLSEDGVTLQLSTLRKLELNEIRCKFCDTHSLLRFIMCCPNLNSLTLRSCPLIDGRALSLLLQTLPHLSSLVINECFGVRLLHLAASSPSLQSLTITKSPRLETLHCSLHTLVECNLSHTSLKSDSISSLVQLNRGLKVLYCDSCRLLDTVSLSAPSLRLLSLSKCSSLICLTLSAPHLHSLSLKYSFRLTSINLYTASLVEIDLSLSSSLSSVHISSLSLVLLDLTGCRLLENTIRSLYEIHAQSSDCQTYSPIMCQNCSSYCAENCAIRSLGGQSPLPRCFHYSSVSLCCPLLKITGIVYPIANESVCQLESKTFDHEVDRAKQKLRRLTV